MDIVYHPHVILDLFEKSVALYAYRPRSASGIPDCIECISNALEMPARFFVFQTSLDGSGWPFRATCFDGYDACQCHGLRKDVATLSLSWGKGRTRLPAA